MRTLETTATRAPGIGDVIGHWRVLEELGRGGMGAVYLVERADGQFEQRAALKLVRGRAPAGTSRRFERERQILASLNHAGIARLLDGGQTPDGRPYFVMEHVDGRAINRYADDERLPLDERLRLFERVAAAVLHAHQRLVVHCDIKPSNIVVTPEGDVKLLDFGIAQLLSPDDAPADSPQSGSVLTPDYASPEQVRGEAPSTASDIYQLGLLLYELLTGHRAQRAERSSRAAMVAAICGTPVVPPSARVAAERNAAVAEARRLSPTGLPRSLRGDLDAIVMHALDKDPQHRYASVGDLIADVQRYRARLPVQAAGGGAMYRLRRFVRRHPAPLAWTAVVFAAVAWFLPQLAQERLRAAREAERAEHVERILGAVFALPAVEPSPRVPTARDYLDHTLALIRQELGDQPASQAHLYERLGRVYNLLGLYPQAIGVVRESLAIRVAVFGADSIEAASSLALLSQSQDSFGQYAEAERNLRQAMQIRKTRFGTDDRQVIFTAIDLADLLHTRGELADAEALLRTALPALERLGEREGIARAARDLGNVLRDRGELAEGEQQFRRAIQMLREMNGPGDPDVATSAVYFARLLIRKGDLREAEQILTSALADLRMAFDGEHPVTGMGMRELGYLRTEQGRYADAEHALDRSERILREWLGEGHSMILRTRAHAAELARRQGDLSSAAALAERTMAEFERLGLGSHPSALDVCLTLGEARIAQGRHDEARSRLAPCAVQAERTFVDGDPRTRRYREVLRRAGDPVTSP